MGRAVPLRHVRASQRTLSAARSEPGCDVHPVRRRTKGKRMSGPRAADTRRPPMPPPPGKMGVCTWCGEAIFFPANHKKAGEVNLRRCWHPGCVDAYKLATQSSWQREACWKRDKGVCATCGIVAVRKGWRRGQKVYYAAPMRSKLGGGIGTPVEWCDLHDWHADHIKPLWSVPPHLPLSERDAWWGIENLQTLCHACHRAKTKREAADRSAHRRLPSPARNES